MHLSHHVFGKLLCQSLNHLFSLMLIKDEPTNYAIEWYEKNDSSKLCEQTMSGIVYLFKKAKRPMNQVISDFHPSREGGRRSQTTYWTVKELNTKS